MAVRRCEKWLPGALPLKQDMTTVRLPERLGAAAVRHSSLRDESECRASGLPGSNAGCGQGSSRPVRRLGGGRPLGCHLLGKSLGRVIQGDAHERQQELESSSLVENARCWSRFGRSAFLPRGFQRTWWLVWRCQGMRGLSQIRKAELGRTAQILEQVCSTSERLLTERGDVPVVVAVRVAVCAYGPCWMFDQSFRPGGLGGRSGKR